METATPLIAETIAICHPYVTWIVGFRFDPSMRIAPPVQNISVQARVNAKRQEVDEKVEHSGWKRKTLDSRFASMKEQRMTINNYGVTVQVPRLPPWARARRFFH